MTAVVRTMPGKSTKRYKLLEALRDGAKNTRELASASDLSQVDAIQALKLMEVKGLCYQAVEGVGGKPALWALSEAGERGLAA